MLNEHLVIEKKVKTTSPLTEIDWIDWNEPTNETILCLITVKICEFEWWYAEEWNLVPVNGMKSFHRNRRKV